jgi:hypothetical protein
VTDFWRKLFAWRSSEDDIPSIGRARQLEHLVRADAHPLLVFDHIPKTAGTTFRRSYLIAAFPRDERWILSGGEKSAEDLDRFLRLPAERRRRIRIIAGHYADALRTRIPDARFVTLVRDPVDRAVSSYLHARFHPGGEALWPDVRRKQMSLRQFVQKYERPNAQSAQLLGEGSFDEAAIRERVGARYALVGCTEAFEQFVFLLHLLEGFPLCLYNNRLVRNERRTYTPPPEDVAFVREMNAQDRLTHQVIRHDFQRRLAEIPAAARETMHRYLDALRQFRAATAGDPAQSLRLDGSARDDQAVRHFDFVFGPQRSGASRPVNRR